MSHSQGPWRVEGVEVRDANDRPVVWELGNRNEDDHRLIAAAPELLDALKRLFDTGLVREFDHTPEYQAVLAVIAKAEGR